MEIFHVGDKVFLLDDRSDIRPHKYGKIIAIYAKNNIMVISLIDKANTSICVYMGSPHIHKIDFLPKEKVVIHDLLKDYCNKKGIVDAYDRIIDRYRVMVDNDPNPHWFAPFELTLEDNDGWSSFSSLNPIKVRLSDEGKKIYEYIFGVEPLVDTKGRTEFTNFTNLYNLIFIYDDKHLLKDDEIFVKEAD